MAPQTPVVKLVTDAACAKGQSDVVQVQGGSKNSSALQLVPLHKERDNIMAARGQ